MKHCTGCGKKSRKGMSDKNCCKCAW